MRRVKFLTGLMLALALNFTVRAAPINPPADPAANQMEFARAKQAFSAAQVRLQTETNQAEAEWQFGRAFDWADCATSKADRARIAQQGIAACRKLIARDPASAPGHYYLGMNLGRLAQTRKLGALKLVDQMEVEFKIALGLDPHFDYAGPDRNLGLLYHDAPGWPVSLGNKAKARQHLQRALKLSPNYPENLLNLIEADLKWDNLEGATRELKSLDELWPAARREFAGEDWASSWADWETRRATAQTQMNETSGAGQKLHRL